MKSVETSGRRRLSSRGLPEHHIKGPSQLRELQVLGMSQLQGTSHSDQSHPEKTCKLQGFQHLVEKFSRQDRLEGCHRMSAAMQLIYAAMSE